MIVFDTGYWKVVGCYDKSISQSLIGIIKLFLLFKSILYDIENLT